MCRTPPQPVSNHHYEMTIEQNYPIPAREFLAKIGLASYIDGLFKVCEPLEMSKVMYAARLGEHLLPTCTKLFSITESSVNLLATTRHFSSNYLTNYVAKTEEHADSNIRSGPAGKSFRLRSDGIVNKSLATTKFLLKQDNSFKKEPESVKCHQLSITESVFWSLGEPYVFTNMKFIHLQNVPMEQRYVLAGKFKQQSSTSLNLFNFNSALQKIKKF